MRANLYNWGVSSQRYQFCMAFILHDSHPAQSLVLSLEEFTNFKWRHLHTVGKEKNWGGNERLHGQISPPAVRWVLICYWHPQQSSLSYPNHLSHPPANPSFLKASLSLTLHTILVSPSQTRELQWSSSFTLCLWALLVPTPLKRLVTQASSGPRVWKPLIEDRSQPKWQIQGRFSVVFAVYCSCLCGGLREGVQLLGAESGQQAMVITCHSSQHFLFQPQPSPAKS